MAQMPNKPVLFQHTATRRWLRRDFSSLQKTLCFNTQPPEGGCEVIMHHFIIDIVSTHSHPKVAAKADMQRLITRVVSTHSHPKVAADSTCS